MGLNLKDANKPSAQSSGSKAYKPVPEGEYYLCIESAKMSESRNGKEYIDLQLRFEGGDNDNRVMWKKFYTTPKALPIFARFLETLGLQEFNDDDNASVVEIFNALIGKTFRANVTIYTPPGGMGKSSNDFGKFSEDDRSGDRTGSSMPDPVSKSDTLPPKKAASALFK